MGDRYGKKGAMTASSRYDRAVQPVSQVVKQKRPSGIKVYRIVIYINGIIVNTIITQYSKQNITEGSIWESVGSPSERKTVQTTTRCKKGKEEHRQSKGRLFIPVHPYQG